MSADETRHCKACGVIPPHGPLEYEWDGHVVDGTTKKYDLPIKTLILTCGDDCRKKLGLTRRKPVQLERILMSFDL